MELPLKEALTKNADLFLNDDRLSHLLRALSIGFAQTGQITGMDPDIAKIKGKTGLFLRSRSGVFLWAN